jgi:drug/metabolite transporter (DMT)-like permease
MNSTVGFAVLSLLFAGLNDVVFKIYSRKKRSRGMNVLGIGVVWSILQASTYILRGTPVVWDWVSISYGLGAGVFLTLSNLLLLESLTYINVGLGSTVYRLNTIILVLFSYWLLNEPMDPIKIIGILCGIIAVVLLYRPDPGYSPDRSVFLIFGCIAILASCLRGGYGVISKAGLLHQANADTMLLVISLNWIIGGGIYAYWREKTMRLTATITGYSILSGILVFLIVNTLMLALKNGQASVVIPIANMSFIVSLAISVLMRFEPMTFHKGMAVVWAGLSITLLARV